MSLLKELRDKIQAVVNAEAMEYDGDEGKAMQARMHAGIALDDFVMIDGEDLVKLLDALQSSADHSQTAQREGR